MIHWLDLLTEGDPHPRRFDSAQTLRIYLHKVERLEEEVITQLLTVGEVAPPVARRGYRVSQGAGSSGR